MTYTFIASSPGTHAYYSGTQGDLQIEMGLYGAVIVLPARRSRQLHVGLAASNVSCGKASGAKLISGWRTAAYDHAKTCYDREYLFQWAEMDPNIHRAGAGAGDGNGWLHGWGSGMQSASPDRALPPSVLPDQRPLHARRHGRQLCGRVSAPALQRQSSHASRRAGPDSHHRPGPLAASVPRARQPCAHSGARRKFDSEPVQSERSRRPLDVQHRHDSWAGLRRNFLLDGPGTELGSVRPQSRNRADATRHASLYAGCQRLQHGSAAARRINYYEWCQDHNKPLEVAPFGDVAGGGPATLPDPNIFTNGPWYGGTPYLGPDATLRSSCTSVHR